MVSVPQIGTPSIFRKIQRVQTVTIAWMSVEAAVSLFASWRASSPALLAFGGDSAIELLSAMVVLWRFRAGAAHEHAERRAARVAGALLFALAAFVAVTSAGSLLGSGNPRPTVLGIAILVPAAPFMPCAPPKPSAAIIRNIVPIVIRIEANTNGPGLGSDNPWAPGTGGGEALKRSGD